MSAARHFGAIGATLLALLGCVEQDITPQPRLLEVQLYGEDRPNTGPLHAIVGWFTPQGFKVVDDVPVIDDRAVVTLAGMPPSLQPVFQPVERVRFEDDEGITFAEFYAVRPRIAIYDDVDRDGRIDPAPPFGLGVDRVVAVDRGSEDGVAWLPDINGVIDATPADYVDHLYRYLGGTFTDFVRVRGARELRANPEWLPFVLEFGDPVLNGALLTCPRFGVYGQQRGTHSVLADPVLPQTLLCDPACRDSAWAQRRPLLAAPADSLPIVESCVQDGRVAVYRARQEGWICAGCLCAQVDHEQMLVADPANPPAWWPCGEDTIPYCEGPRCGTTCVARDCGAQ